VQFVVLFYQVLTLGFDKWGAFFLRFEKKLDGSLYMNLNTLLPQFGIK